MITNCDGVSRIVQCSIGHGYLWWRGLMTGLLRGKPRHLPSPFRERQVKYCGGRL